MVPKGPQLDVATLQPVKSSIQVPSLAITKKKYIIFKINFVGEIYILQLLTGTTHRLQTCQAPNNEHPTRQPQYNKKTKI